MTYKPRTPEEWDAAVERERKRRADAQAAADATGVTKSPPVYEAKYPTGKLTAFRGGPALMYRKPVVSKQTITPEQAKQLISEKGGRILGAPAPQSAPLGQNVHRAVYPVDYKDAPLISSPPKNTRMLEGSIHGATKPGAAGMTQAELAGTVIGWQRKQDIEAAGRAIREATISQLDVGAAGGPKDVDPLVSAKREDPYYADRIMAQMQVAIKKLNIKSPEEWYWLQQTADPAGQFKKAFGEWTSLMGTDNPIDVAAGIAQNLLPGIGAGKALAAAVPFLLRVDGKALKIAGKAIKAGDKLVDAKGAKWIVETANEAGEVLVHNPDTGMKLYRPTTAFKAVEAEGGAAIKKAVTEALEKERTKIADDIVKTAGTVDPTKEAKLAEVTEVLDKANKGTVTPDEVAKAVQGKLIEADAPAPPQPPLPPRLVGGLDAPEWNKRITTFWSDIKGKISPAEEATKTLKRDFYASQLGTFADNFQALHDKFGAEEAMKIAASRIAGNKMLFQPVLFSDTITPEFRAALFERIAAYYAGDTAKMLAARNALDKWLGDAAKGILPGRLVYNPRKPTGAYVLLRDAFGAEQVDAMVAVQKALEPKQQIIPPEVAEAMKTLQSKRDPNAVEMPLWAQEFRNSGRRTLINTAGDAPAESITDVTKAGYGQQTFAHEGAPAFVQEAQTIMPGMEPKLKSPPVTQIEPGVVPIQDRYFGEMQRMIDAKQTVSEQELRESLEAYKKLHRAEVAEAKLKELRAAVDKFGNHMDENTTAMKKARAEVTASKIPESELATHVGAHGVDEFGNPIIDTTYKKPNIQTQSRLGRLYAGLDPEQQSKFWNEVVYHPDIQYPEVQFQLFPETTAAKQLAQLPQTTRTIVGQKLARAGAELLDILGIAKSVKSAMDISMPFRQGLMLGLENPRGWAKAWGPMMKALKNEDIANGVMKEIRDDLARAAWDVGASVEDVGHLDMPTLSRTAGYGERLETNASKIAEKWVPGVRPSQRAATVFVAALQADSWKKLADPVKMAGGGANDFKALGQYINWSVGRAQLSPVTLFGKGLNVQGISPVLNILMFSPRLVASRLALPAKMFSSNPVVAKSARKAFASLVIGGGTLLGLYHMGSKLSGGEGLEIDPRSADFAKMKFGKTRVDMFGGYLQYMRFIRQMVGNFSEGQAKTQLGDIRPKTRTEIARQLWTSKESPVVGLFNDFIAGQTREGESIEATWKSIGGILSNQFLSLAISDLVDATFSEGLANGPKPEGALALLSAVGIGVQTYDPPNKVDAIKMKAAKYRDIVESVNNDQRLFKREQAIGTINSNLGAGWTLDNGQVVSQTYRLLTSIESRLAKGKRYIEETRANRAIPRGERDQLIRDMEEAMEALAEQAYTEFEAMEAKAALGLANK